MTEIIKPTLFLRLVNIFSFCPYADKVTSSPGFISFALQKRWRQNNNAGNETNYNKHRKVARKIGGNDRHLMVKNPHNYLISLTISNISLISAVGVLLLFTDHNTLTAFVP